MEGKNKDGMGRKNEIESIGESHVYTRWPPPLSFSGASYDTLTLSTRDKETSGEREARDNRVRRFYILILKHNSDYGMLLTFSKDSLGQGEFD